MRLIDADAVLKELKKSCEYHAENSRELSLLQRDIIIVQEQPTVDAVPVRHGKWIDMADFEQCSVCTGTHLKEVQGYYGKMLWVKTPYCPNCGARMVEDDFEH